MRNFTDEQIVTLQAQLIVVGQERDEYKAELGRIAAAVYPHKEVPFTYSVDFVIDEIERARVRESDLTQGIRERELWMNDATRRCNEMQARGVEWAAKATEEAECNKPLRERVKTLEDALYRAINNLSHFGICRTPQTGNTRDCTCAIAELLEALAPKEPKAIAVVVAGICKCGHARMEHEPDCVFYDCAAYEFVAKEAKA